jgi:hypothetical protein
MSSRRENALVYTLVIDSPMQCSASRTGRFSLLTNPPYPISLHCNCITTVLNMPILTNTTNASEEHLAISSFDDRFQFSECDWDLVSISNDDDDDDDDDCFDLLDDNDSVQYSGDLDKCLFADDDDDDDEILSAGEDEEVLEVVELVGDIKKSLKDASYKLMPSTTKLEQSWTKMLSLQSSSHSTLKSLWRAKPSLE